MRSIVFALSIASCICFSGCDKLKQLDETQTELANLKQRVDQLEATQNNRLDLIEIDQGRIHNLLDADLKQPEKKADQQEDSISKEQIPILEKTIKQCVQSAREIVPSQDYEKHFYQNFDAYYNPADGRVVNNVRVNGEMPALYAFNKCMVSNGFPLK